MTRGDVVGALDAAAAWAAAVLVWASNWRDWRRPCPPPAGRRLVRVASRGPVLSAICPMCAAHIPIHIVGDCLAVDDDGVLIFDADTDLADVHAHAWTHEGADL